MATKLETFDTSEPARADTGAPARPVAFPFSVSRSDGDVRREPAGAEAGEQRLGPARGLLLGLALGAVMWAVIIVLAWAMLR